MEIWKFKFHIKPILSHMRWECKNTEFKHNGVIIIESADCNSAEKTYWQNIPVIKENWNNTMFSTRNNTAALPIKVIIAVPPV